MGGPKWWSYSLNGLSDVILIQQIFQFILLIINYQRVSSASYNVGVGKGVFDALTSGQYWCRV